MKKTVYSIAVATMVCLASCGYNDDDVWNAINNQEERITALENWQKTINENIAALQALVNENDYITDVTPIVENGETTGYIISFFKQGSITIYNGAKGDKGETGDTPSIGVTKQEDGKYYWTLNGELLKDAEGNPICASGQDGEDGEDGSDGSNGSSGTSAPTPQIKLGKDLSISQDQYGSTINDEDVCLSVDGGKTWVKISGTGSDNIFASAPVDNGAFWTFPLSNGTEINVPKYIHLLLYSVIGNEEKLISNAELKVNEGQEFSILCRPADGCKWSYQVRDSKNNWEITKTEDGLNIKAESEGTSIILLFTLTTPDNQAYFYQVTVETVKNAIIQKEDNAALAQALAQVLSGVTLDSEGNATITQETIDNTSSLYLSGRQLTSLEGLDCFVNLTSLDCSQNQLTEIDCSRFSKLTDFNCSNNSLTALDLTNLTELEFLYCSNNNLSNLDVSNNPKLKKLDCNGNSLPTLDISTLKELTYLNCSECFNGLSRSLYSNGTIDLSNHPNLEYLYCNENNLQTLDVTHTPKLKELSCNGNNLTELDLSKNTELYYLNCDENNLQTLNVIQTSKLNQLSCYGNNLIELDLSKNTELYYLECSNNNLTTLDISQNKLLKILSIYGNKITQLNLSNNESLEYLSCSQNNLELLNISNSSILRSLYCENNRMYTLDISHNLQLEDIRCGYQHNTEGAEQVLILTINEGQVSQWETNWKDYNYNVTISDQVIDKFGGNSNNFTNGGVY
jgi:Leucine-rich repeat (LRR) protein